MKLTQSQITQLYKFTKQHYVEFFDVQTELVDHLANDIEQIWEKHPHLSFEKARDISFKKFGVFGFMDVIEQKQKAMNKKYRKILWRFVKAWFSMPKIAITATIFFFFFTLLQIKYSEYILVGVIAILIVFDMVKIFVNKRKNKKKKERKEKIFLLESMIGETRNGFTGFSFISLFNFLQLIKFNFSSLAIHWVFIISIIATLLCILFYVINYIIPQKAEELLEEIYPEYKMI